MGTLNTKINGNDTFLDIYQTFFYHYNAGQNPLDISKQMREDFADAFEDLDDKNNCLFGLAMAQWETKSLEPQLFDQVKKIIESGNDIQAWKDQGADEKTLRQRQTALNKFLAQLSIQRDKPRRRAKQKFTSTINKLVDLPAPDGEKTFTVTESFGNGKYMNTIAMLEWPTMGGSVFFFTEQGKSINAKWIDRQTLEISHDKTIVFIKKDETFFCGGEIKIIYVPQ